MGFFGNIGTALGNISQGIVSTSESFAKAANEATSTKNIEASEEEPQGLVWDPFSIIEQLGYKDKPSALTYGTLQAMVWRVPVIQGVIVSRLNQVASFARRQQNKFETGFRISLADKEAKMSPADKKFSKQIEDMFQTTGVIQNNRLERCTFNTFLRSITRDSLTYDQMCFEITKNRRGQPAAWYAMDAATIRLADTSSITYTTDPDRIHTVQLFDNMVINQWTKDRMAFCTRNPHTNIRLYGYGVSELEMLVHAVTAIIWAFDYNQKFFSQGSVAKGVLNIKGTMNADQLRAFRRHWYQMISGIENAWRSPVLNSSEGAEWVDMHSSNRDMEFSQWMDFLIKLIGGVYQIDPMEIGFKYGDTGQQKSMFESGNKEKLTASKDKGLKPLLMFLEDEFTRYIVSQINPDFCFEFVGLERETKKELAELNQIKVKSTHTLNELRAEQDMEPIEEGDIVLDPTYVQHLDNLQQQKLQQQQIEQQDAQFQDGQLNDALNGDLDRQNPDEEEDEDSFSEDDFAKFQDRSQGSAGPAGAPKPPKFGKSLKKSRQRTRTITLEV